MISSCLNVPFEEEASVAKKSVGLAGAMAVTFIWLLLTIESPYTLLSIVCDRLFLVNTVPLYVPVDEGVIRVFVYEKLKQYWVFGDKLELGNVTTFPLTEVAVPIPGQAVPPAGRFVTLTVQLPGLAFTVNPDGKIICSEFSLPFSAGGVVAHKVPPVALPVDMRDNLRKVGERLSPYIF